MENRVLGIVGANIRGLEEMPSFDSSRGEYVKSITFSNCSYGKVKYMTPILLGKTRERATSAWNDVKAKLEKLSIKEGSRVLFFYDDKNGNVIGITHVNANVWLDVSKDFMPKRFMHLISCYDALVMKRESDGFIFN